MAGIETINNFSYKGRKYLDDRQSAATTQQLKNWNFVQVPIPEGFKCYCEQTKNWYIYRSTNTFNNTTGFFVRDNDDIHVSLDSILESLEQIEPQVAALRTEMVQAQQDIENLQERTSDLEATTTVVQVNLQTVNQNIQELAASFRQQQMEINAISSERVSCRGYFVSVAQLQETYPIAYDADFAYVADNTTSNPTTFHIYRYNGSTQAWEYSGSAPMVSDVSVQGLLAEGAIDLVNASKYESGIASSGCTVYANLAQFLVAESQQTPVLPTKMRKRGMVVTLLLSYNGSYTRWQSFQFRGTSLNNDQWCSINYWTRFPMDGIFTDDSSQSFDTSFDTSFS